MLLARQGFNAQYRRQSIPRIALTTSHAVDTSSGAENSHLPLHVRRSIGSSGRLRSASDGYVKQISIPPRHATRTDALNSGDPHHLVHSARALSSNPSVSPPYSPSSKSLHERYSAQFLNASIEEEDGDDCVVIHNGVKRLSLSEEGIVLQGRPKLVII
ncbi:hypothetical protein GQ54DRAFT_294749 [Martensiomyces pterosporus]|nr:hypothetical protein GQ54DRAFT_294749 [Martensiomyces pterosporus]